MEKSLKSISINNGIILGIILSAIIVLVYVIDIELFLAPWLGIFIVLLSIGLGIFSSIKTKRAKSGFITFKESFSSYFITVAVGLIFPTIITYLLLTIIDPETGAFLNEKLVEITIEAFKNFGMSEENLEKTIAQTEGVNNFGLWPQTQGYLFRLVILSIIGLISSLVIKRNDPNAA